MMALQLLFTAVVERPLRPRAPSAASVRAATPAERSSARSDFLFLFRGTHGDFRLSEVRSVAETLGVGPVSFRSAGAAGTLQASGGDVGPSVFQFVSLPDAEAAAAVARRCVLVRGAFEVWASAEAGDGDAWDALAVDVAAAPAADRRRWLAPLVDDAATWRADVHSFGRSKPYGKSQTRALLSKFSEVLWNIPGKVDLDDPSHVVSLLEDYEAERRDGQLAAPRRVHIGRQLADGGGRRLNEFALSDRPYLSRTALPPTVAFLMANAARIGAESSAFDPFCGSASTLLAAAALGAAATVGCDLDPRHCAPPRDGQASIADNFAAAGLAPPTLVRADAAAVLAGEALPAEDVGAFDAIVTDPPYGVMEGLGSTYLPMRERVHQLLQIAATRLRVGGRLVFLLPVPAEAAGLPPLPQLPSCLALERAACARQPLSTRMHRWMLTLEKVGEPTEADLAPWDATAADADELPWESDEAVARHVSPHVGACAPWRGEVRDT